MLAHFVNNYDFIGSVGLFYPYDLLI